MPDTVTLYAVVAVVALGGAALVAYFSTQRPDALGARAWAGGMACLTVFFSSLILRSYLPAFVSFVFGNGIAMAALALMHRGACQITARPFPGRWHAVAALAAMTVLAVLWPSPIEGYHARVIFMGLITSTQSTVIALTLWPSDPRGQDAERSARQLSAAVFVALALLQLGRVITTVFGLSGELTLLANTAMTRTTAAMLLAIVMAMPFLVVYVNEARARQTLRQTIGDLQQTLAEVKTLRGLIPICSSCRRIRDTDQTWGSIERYLDAHTDMQLSHGVCPDCMRKLYPEFADQILNG